MQIDLLSASTDAAMIKWLLANQMNLGNRNFSSSRGTALARVLATTSQDDRRVTETISSDLQTYGKMEYFEARLRYHLQTCK